MAVLKTDNCSLNIIFMTYVSSMTEIRDEANTNSYLRPYHKNHKLALFSGSKFISHTHIHTCTQNPLQILNSNDYFCFKEYLWFDITFPICSASVKFVVCGQFVSHSSRTTMKQSLFSFVIKKRRKKDTAVIRSKKLRCTCVFD